MRRFLPHITFFFISLFISLSLTHFALDTPADTPNSLIYISLTRTRVLDLDRCMQKFGVLENKNSDLINT